MTASALDTTTPEAWNRTLSGAPVLDRAAHGALPVRVRRWQAIAPAIDQVALDQHYVALHLGGPKRLHRQGEGGSRTRDVPWGVHSVIPAGSAFHWHTQGPVDFVHVYVEPRALDDLITDRFDRDPAAVRLQEGLGEIDPLTRSLGLTLIEELATDHPQRAYVDDIVHLLLCRVLRLHSNARTCPAAARQPLAPFRLRRAIDFIERSLADPIGVAEIAAASGVSPFHFSRAFRQTTGRPPYAYLLDRRIARAKDLLATQHAPLTTIADQCGFASPGQFSRMFRRQTGVTPSQFRDAR